MQKYNTIMIDTETLGVDPNSPIVQIGIQPFNVRGDHIDSICIESGFFIRIRPDFSETMPSVDTLAWWLDQEEESRSELSDSLRNGVGEYAAVMKLREFFGNHITEDVMVWANPPEFDCVKVDNLMKRRGYPSLWKYNNTRCLRTLAQIAGADKEDRVEPSIPHHALYDAQAQASTMMKYYNMIKQRYSNV